MFCCTLYLYIYFYNKPIDARPAWIIFEGTKAFSSVDQWNDNSLNWNDISLGHVKFWIVFFFVNLWYIVCHTVQKSLEWLIISYQLIFFKYYTRVSVGVSLVLYQTSASNETYYNRPKITPSFISWAMSGTMVLSHNPKS